MSETQNVPETIRLEMKQRALKIIEANAGCVSYVKAEDLETQCLFIPVVSIIKPLREEFHDQIPGIGFMAKVPLMNTIREKAGVSIIRTDTEKRSEYVWVAHSFGERRQPDGTMLPGDSSYEFDAEKRAELDFLKDSEKPAKDRKYATDIEKRKYILGLCKFGEQKAVTGAQLALIHKLAHIPASFKTPEELMRGMIVCRIDRNVNGVLADPGLRSAALDRMLGATDQVFGPKQIEAEAAPVPRTVDPTNGEVLQAQAQPAGEEQGALEFKDIPFEKPEETARRKLESFLALERKDGRLSTSEGWKSASGLIRAMLNNKDTVLKGMEDLIARVEAWLDKNGVKTGDAA